MRKTTIALPLLALIAATRGMLGAGAGLLIGERLDGATRRALGWALVAIGVASTVPLAWIVLRGRR